MKRISVLGAAVCAAVIGHPGRALAQDDVIVAPEPESVVASATPIADAIPGCAAAIAGEAVARDAGD